MLRTKKIVCTAFKPVMHKKDARHPQSDPIRVSAGMPVAQHRGHSPELSRYSWQAMASVVAMQLFSSRGRGVAVISLEHSQARWQGGFLMRQPPEAVVG